MISDYDPCANCWHYIALAVDPRLAPVPPIVQEAVGGDTAALERFFEPAAWAKNWTFPMAIVFGTAEEWRAVAAMWRETRERREGRYLSLAEIEKGWESQ